VPQAESAGKASATMMAAPSRFCALKCRTDMMRPLFVSKKQAHRGTAIGKACFRGV
jgi:hypothetical protein